MAILNFPITPSPGNQYTENGVTWQWDGVSWNVVATIPAGYTGSNGFVGSLGYTGSYGYTGSSGYTGSIGIGYAGSVGVTNVDYGVIYAMRTF